MSRRLGVAPGIASTRSTPVCAEATYRYGPRLQTRSCPHAIEGRRQRLSDSCPSLYMHCPYVITGPAPYSLSFVYFLTRERVLSLSVRSGCFLTPPPFPYLLFKRQTAGQRLPWTCPFIFYFFFFQVRDAPAHPPTPTTTLVGTD